MQFESFFLDEGTILDYLRVYGHDPDSKDYEFFAAILVKRLFEENSGQPYCIAFELRESLLKYKPDFLAGNLEHVKDVLENNRVENTPIDFLLVQGNVTSHQKEGYGFQLKRYTRNSSGSLNEDISQYINSISAEKYPRLGEVGLIVIPSKRNGQSLFGKNTTFNLKAIAKSLRLSQDSFKKILILMSFEDSENRLVSLSELWPGRKQLTMTLPK